jgi:hypothetical protein
MPIARRTAVAAIAVSLLAAAGGGYYAYRSTRDETWEVRLERIIIAPRYEPSACGPDKPLAVRVHNRSNGVLIRLSWQLAAFKAGDTANLVEGFERYVTEERLQPRQIANLCMPAPQLKAGIDPAAVRYQPTWKLVRFLHD